jgi:hypothetical protein
MADMSIFDEDEFTLTSLTSLANQEAPVPGQVGAAFDFEEEGITTTSIKIETRGSSLALVEPTPRGGPGEVIDHEGRGLRTFEATHLQRDESVYADEVQGVRATGSATEAETLQSLTDRKMTRHFRDFDLTTEWMRLGALCGKIVSGKGLTILDLYREFDLIAPDPIVFDLASATYKVRRGADTVRMGMEDDLDAPAYGSVVALCGAEFFQSLIDHPEVRATFLNTAAAVELRGQLPDRFSYGGITWERYRASAKARAAVGGSFIPADEARLGFTGVAGLWLSRYAPADYLDTVNTVGVPRYVREMDEERTAKRAKFEVQSNPIILCTQPKTLRRLKLKAA